MAKTAVADIIIPTQFEQYAIERTAELAQFGQCGIVEASPEFDVIASEGGREVKMPFWKDLTAARQLLSDSASLVVNKITSDQDIARIHNDAQTWSVNHLSKVISGDDPMQAIVDLVGEYWARTDEGLIVSCLKGMFAAGSMSGNLLGIHSESVAGQSSSTRLNGSTFVDTCLKLGDRADRLTAVAMHSATEAALRKLDATPLQGGIGTEGVEMARVPLDSDTLLINRRRYILHPRGVKFTSASVAGDSPTNAELETGSNWTRVWEIGRAHV